MVESRLYRLQAARLAEVRQKMLESLGEGAAADYAAYKDMVGYLRGLRDALQLCEEIEKGIE